MRIAALVTALVGALVAVQSALISSAAAQERVQLESRGECPSASMLAAALLIEGVLVAKSAEIKVVVESTASGAVLVIPDEDGSAVRRVVESTDCEALAEALALIISVAVFGRSSGKPTPPAVSKPDTTLPSAPSNSTTIAPGDAPSVSQSRRALEGSQRALWLGVGLGLWADAAFGRPAFGAVDATFCATGWCGYASLRVAESSDSVGVERRQFAAGVRGGKAWKRKGTEIRLLFGADAVVSRVGGPTALRVTRGAPALVSSIGMTVPVESRANLRVDIAGLFFPTRDRYLTGEIELLEAPRFQLLASISLEFAVNR